MYKLCLIMVVAMLLIACSDQATNNGEVTDDIQSGVTPEMLSGTYAGYFSGVDMQDWSMKPFLMPIEFIMTDSSFAWSNGVAGLFGSEWGNGPYNIAGDSLHFTDTEDRQQHRIYIIIDGNYRFAFADDVLTFFREFNDSFYHIVTLEKIN